MHVEEVADLVAASKTDQAVIQQDGNCVSCADRLQPQPAQVARRLQTLKRLHHPPEEPLHRHPHLLLLDLSTSPHSTPKCRNCISAHVARIAKHLETGRVLQHHLWQPALPHHPQVVARPLVWASQVKAQPVRTYHCLKLDAVDPLVSTVAAALEVQRSPNLADGPVDEPDD